MSPRAACRLAELGFEEIYDYVQGIADWKAAGRPIEGSTSTSPTAIDAMRTDIPTVSTGDTLDSAKQRLADTRWDEAVVVDEGVVAGRLRGDVWDREDEPVVSEIMELGPTTVRADEPLLPLLERMEKRSTRLVLVTSPQGEYLGVVTRVDAAQVTAGGSISRVWRECDGCPGHWASP